jgi:hypothetical protein
MDTGKPITNFDIESLKALGGRLFDHLVDPSACHLASDRRRGQPRGMNLRKFIFWITGTSIEEARMLFWRGVVWVFFTTFVGGILFGIVAVYETFGLPAMWIAVFLLYLLYLWTEHRKPIYFGDGYDMLWLGDRKPSLPPPASHRCAIRHTALPACPPVADQAPFSA